MILLFLTPLLLLNNVSLAQSNWRFLAYVPPQPSPHGRFEYISSQQTTKPCGNLTQAVKWVHQLLPTEWFMWARMTKKSMLLTLPAALKFGTFQRTAEWFLALQLPNGMVYVGSEDHNLYALNARTGNFDLEFYNWLLR